MWVFVLIANNVSKSSVQISLFEIAYEFLVAEFFFAPNMPTFKKRFVWFYLSYLFNLLAGSEL